LCPKRDVLLRTTEQSKNKQARQEVSVDKTKFKKIPLIVLEQNTDEEKMSKADVARMKT
jgi:hypothetical protein